MNALDIYCATVSEPNEKDIDDFQTISTIYGTNCEPLIREMVKLNFANKFAIEDPQGYVMYRRTDKPFMTATLDGLMTTIDTPKKEKWILEIKTHDVQSGADLEEWNGHLPQNYFIQCLHYLAVLNDTKGAYLVAKLRYVDYDTGLPRTADNGKCGEEIRYYKIEREDFKKDIAKLEQVETEFYEKHIKNKIPPEIKIDIMEE